MKAIVEGSHKNNQSKGIGIAQEKIIKLADLTEFLVPRRAEGATVALAHGVFDVLHIGHIRHLEAAGKEADILVVSITSDCYVNKGPDRPVFNELLRAEAIAAMEVVDFVTINNFQTSENVIDRLKPDVYVKGVEYADTGNDVTGQISLETGLVEGYGGRVVYTDDITYSSSALINQHLDIYDPALKDYLSGVRDSGMADRIKYLLSEIAPYKVLLVGDAIIDEYQYVEPLGKSPKENMIATLFRNTEIFAGGVFAAANHIAEFCSEVEVICTIGEGKEGFEDEIRSALKKNVTLTPVIRRNLPTTRKCRFIDTSYGMRKLFEVYFMDDHPVTDAQDEELERLIVEKMHAADLVVVTDFGHGLISNAIVEKLEANAKFLCVNAQSNSANHGFNLITKYGRADYICVDQPEARLAVQDIHIDIEKVVSDILPALLDCPRLVVTAGKHGCYTFNPDEGLGTVPALTSTVLDSVGAGDAFFALSAPFVKAGANMAEAGFIGNVAGAMKVGIVGHRESVGRIQFEKFVTAILK